MLQRILSEKRNKKSWIFARIGQRGIIKYAEEWFFIQNISVGRLSAILCPISMLHCTAIFPITTKCHTFVVETWREKENASICSSSWFLELNVLASTTHLAILFAFFHSFVWMFLKCYRKPQFLFCKLWWDNVVNMNEMTMDLSLLCNRKIGSHYELLILLEMS